MIKIINNIISMPDWSGTPDPRGVGYFYYTRMLENGHKIAQIDGITKEEDSFYALLHRSIQTAMAMQNRGIKSGDFISLCTFNHLNTCVPYIASLFIGVKMAAVEPGMSVKEIVYLLKQVPPKIIFVASEALDLIEEVVEEIEANTEIVVFGESIKHTSFSQFLTARNVHDFKPVEIENLEEIAFVVFSSGTTGLPKGICLSHRAMLADTTVDKAFEGVTLASFASPYWTVFTTFVHLSITRGASRLVYPRFDSNAPWEMFNHKIFLAFLNPIQAMALVKCRRPEQIDSSNLKILALGANPCSSNNMLKIKAAIPHTILQCGYGQSEVFSGITSFPINSRGYQLSEQQERSAGTVKTGFSYKVVDPETEEVLGPNQCGELRIRSRAQFSGYCNMDSSESFDSDGWLKTGDIVYYNEDLFFFITDRLKESFKYINHHIIPSEIENVLLTHPLIEQVVVVGVPHNMDCNHATAVVVLMDCAKDVTPEELVKYVDERVEDKKRLRGGVKFTNNFPFTITNKVQRFKLRQMIINNEI